MTQPEKLDLAFYQSHQDLYEMADQMWSYLCNQIPDDVEHYDLGTEHMLANVSPDLAAFYLIRRLDFEWENNLDCYFETDAGERLLQAAIQALEKIGAKEQAGLIRELIPAFEASLQELVEAEEAGDEAPFDRHQALVESWMNRYMAADERFNPVEALFSDIQQHPERYIHPNNTFHSAAAGFSITKPDSWMFMTRMEISQYRENIRLKDEDFAKLIRERAHAPLAAIAKYPPGHDDLNPTIQIGLRPLGAFDGQPAVTILNALMPTLGGAFKGFKMIQGVEETPVSGLPAAFAKYQFTITNPVGRSFPVTARQWLVPRGAFTFIIGMSGKQKGPDVCEEEFSQAFQSIRIEP